MVIARLTMREACSLIERKIALASPFSMVRLGDGEWGLLRWPGVDKNSDYARRRAGRWFDVSKIRHPQFLLMRKYIHVAFMNADLIGVPSVHEARAWPKWASFNEIMVRLNLVESHKLYFHFYEIGPMYASGFFDRILRGRDSVGVITCRSIGDRLAERYSIGHVETVLVPGEVWRYKSRCRQETNGYREHWPRRFEEIRRHLTKQKRHGELWLVGAGGLGKVYCNLVKSVGGIALDIGALFDGWAGLRTRPFLEKDVSRYAIQ